MKQVFAISTLLLFGAHARFAAADSLYVQPLPNWDNGYCSPCVFQDYRVFASFTLSSDSVLTGATFAIHDLSSGANDIQISIWDAPFGNRLHFVSLAESEYSALSITPDTYTAAVEFPGWRLDAGSYYISLYGDTGNPIGWGTNEAVSGDDLQFNHGILSNDDIYVGFSLSGFAVPEPTTSALLVVVGLMVVCLRSH